MENFTIFTLAEANDLLPEVMRVTDEAIARLAEMEYPWGKLPFRKYDALQGVAAEDLIRAEWAYSIAQLGVQPKGFFVVDFQSPDPDTLYCWGHGETVVEHEHKTWESFIDRRVITNAAEFESRPPAPPDFRDQMEDFSP